MSSPLPHLPEQPLGELPDNPLGAAPRAPLGHAVIGKREPLRLPEFIRQRRAEGRRSTSSPLPDLRRMTRATQPKPQPAAPIPIKRRQRAPTPQAPVIVSPRPRQTPPAAPAATRATPPPPPPAPAAQRPNVPGRMAQPPITPTPGTRHSLHARLERQRRGAEAYMAMHDEGTNPLADALRHHVPPAPGQRRGPRSGQGLTPEQRAQMQENAAAMRAALNNEGPNDMEHALRHLGEQPPQGGQP